MQNNPLSHNTIPTSLSEEYASYLIDTYCVRPVSQPFDRNSMINKIVDCLDENVETLNQIASFISTEMTIGVDGIKNWLFEDCETFNVGKKNISLIGHMIFKILTLNRRYMPTHLSCEDWEYSVKITDALYLLILRTLRDSGMKCLDILNLEYEAVQQV